MILHFLNDYLPLYYQELYTFMKSHSTIDEKELLLRLRDGDGLAFELLYDTYKEPLAKKIFRILKSWDNTQEILQEAFVRVKFIQFMMYCLQP